MFDFLKKKITGFIDKLSGKEEKKSEEAKPEIKKEEPPKLEVKEEIKPELQQPKQEIKLSETKTEPKIEIKPENEIKIEPEKKAEKIEIPKEKPKEEIKKEIPVTKQEIKIPEIKSEQKIIEKSPEIKFEEKKIIPEAKPPEPKIEPKPLAKPAEPAQEKPREVKLGLFSAIKGFITGEVEIGKSEVDPLLEEFELELLESDVAMEVAEFIKQDLHNKLIGAKVGRSEVSKYIQATIGKTLVELLTNEKQFDLLERIKQAEKPIKIMFIGPNGAGKTTTMAKIANLLIKHGHKVVFSASDTFRAAAIEQLALHAQRLNVPIIRHTYGSDPTAVAFDAVAYAKAHSIDVVLIDSAGRQDTNLNLLNELKKMQRVIKPDLKIYIGEAIAGQALLDQVKAFHQELALDGVILTKLDCDPKGGTMLSVSKATGLPILYAGIGQKYEDLEIFNAEKIARRIMA